MLERSQSFTNFLNNIPSGSFYPNCHANSISILKIFIIIMESIFFYLATIIVPMPTKSKSDMEMTRSSVCHTFWFHACKTQTHGFRFGTTPPFSHIHTPTPTHSSWYFSRSSTDVNLQLSGVMRHECIWMQRHYHKKLLFVYYDDPNTESVQWFDCHGLPHSRVSFTLILPHLVP